MLQCITNVERCLARNFFCNNCQAHMNNRSCKCGNMHNLQLFGGCKKPKITESESVGFDIMEKVEFIYTSCHLKLH